MSNNHKINALQFSLFIIFPIISFFSGIGFHNIIMISGVDAWISVIISFILGFLILLLTIFLFNFEPDKNIHEKIKFIFGNIIGTIIDIVIDILIFIISIISLYGICNFIVSQYLSETPFYIIALLLGVITIYNISKNIEGISRVNIIMLVIILFLSILSFISLIPKIDFSNIKPTLEYGINNPIMGGIILTLTNVVPIFSLLCIPKNQIIGYSKINKYLIIFYIFSYIFIFFITFKTIGVLGIYLTKAYQFPEYIVLRKINILDFFDKVENIISVKWFFSSFSTLSLLIFYLEKSIKKRGNNIYFLSIITLSIILSSMVLFKNNTMFTNFIENIYPAVGLIVLLLFVFIYIFSLIKRKKA